MIQGDLIDGDGDFIVIEKDFMKAFDAKIDESWFLNLGFR